jgi:endo-1,4-beta-mannosidase
VKLAAVVVLGVAASLTACRPDSDFTPPDFSAIPYDLGTPPDDADTSHFVQSMGGHLVRDGRRFRFVGANRYDVASSPTYTCGNYYDDAQLDALLSGLQATGATVLRAWAFQRFTNGGDDFSSIDRMIASARSHGLLLILTLENEWADCTQPDPSSSDGRKSPAWFESGYYTDSLGSDALPYRDWARLVVLRYRDEPQIAMWQLMNEAECTDGAALLAFADDMSQVVKGIDPAHLLSLGTVGTGQAGTTGGAYRGLHNLAGIDVVEAHDYNNESTALPSAISSDIGDAMALGKPFFIGEAGIAAPAPPYMFSYAQRAAFFDAKIAAQWSAGTDGFLIWSWWDGKTDNTMGWDVSPTDPTSVILSKHAAEQP